MSEQTSADSAEVLYAVQDGLPNMLVEDARPWPEEHAGGARG